MAAARNVRASALALAVGCLCLLGASPAAGGQKPLQVKECRQVVVEVEDHDAKETGERVGKYVCEKAMRLAPMFGLVKGQLVYVRIAADAKSFHALTGKSYYTLAVFMSRGIRDMIITQPASILRSDERVLWVVTHELIHLMIRRAVGRRCPMWLNEGLAQWYEGRKATGPLPADEKALEALEARWHDRSVAVRQRGQDYKSSLALVSLLMHHVGEEALLGAVRKLRRERKPLDVDIDGRSIRMWLFHDRPADFGADAPASQVQVEVRPGLDMRRPRPGKKKKDSGMTKLPLEEMLKRARQKEGEKK